MTAGFNIHHVFHLMEENGSHSQGRGHTVGMIKAFTSDFNIYHFHKDLLVNFVQSWLLD